MLVAHSQYYNDHNYGLYMKYNTTRGNANWVHNNPLCFGMPRFVFVYILCLQLCTISSPEDPNESLYHSCGCIVVILLISLMIIYYDMLCSAGCIILFTSVLATDNGSLERPAMK